MFNLQKIFSVSLTRFTKAVELNKMARGLRFWILEEVMYYVSYERNCEGADKLATGKLA